MEKRWISISKIVMTGQLSACHLIGYHGRWLRVVTSLVPLISCGSVAKSFYLPKAWFSHLNYTLSSGLLWGTNEPKWNWEVNGVSFLTPTWCAAISLWEAKLCQPASGQDKMILIHWKRWNYRALHLLNFACQGPPRPGSGMLPYKHSTRGREDRRDCVLSLISKG